MKVLFLINNYYIQTAAMSRVAAHLGDMGMECSLFYIGDDAAKYKADPVEGARASAAGLAESPLYALNTRGGAFNRVIQFVRLVANSLAVDRFIAAQKPSVVVMATDIASMNSRLALDACDRAGIEVILMPLVIPGPAIVNTDTDKGVPAAAAVRMALRALGLEKVVFFRGWVPGSYHSQAMIALPDEPARRTLEDNGIEPSRLRVVGSPAHDIVFDAMRREPSECRALLYGQYGIPAEGKLVCFCTTVLQEIYGHEFTLSMARMVKRFCQNIMPGVRVAVKLHPREPGEMVDAYRELFGVSGFHVLPAADNLVLLRASDLVLGTYTNMLNHAAMLGTPVLDIRLMDDPRYPLVFGPPGGWTHAASAEDIEKKAPAVLFDVDAREAALREIALWRESLGVAVDGRAAERTAQLICERALAARRAA